MTSNCTGAPGTMEIVPYSGITDDQLRTELRRRGLPLDGDTAALRDRLLRSFLATSVDPLGSSNIVPAEANPFLRLDFLNILHSQRNIRFSGRREEDASEFLMRIEDLRRMIPISDAGLFLCLPFALTDIALRWYRVEKTGFRRYQDFEVAFINRFEDPDFQFKLREELLRRTQGEGEGFMHFILCLRMLLQRVVPPFSLEQQLDYAYRNMLPRLKISIRRSDFASFEELERIAVLFERHYLADRYCKNPPALGR